MRIGCDTGGTFTDLVVSDGGVPRIYKAPTTPHRPIDGIIDALKLAAGAEGQSLEAFLGRASVFLHGTTHPLNAVVTRRTAKTAFLVTKGHRDILTLREGGRTDPFDKSEPFPAPYIPQALTFEIDERVLWNGDVDRPIDETQVIAVARDLRRRDISAVAVCLLWAIRNPDHEQTVKRILAAELPGCDISLSCEVSPMMREFRRASATAIDASLKGFVRQYLVDLEADLQLAGLKAPILLIASDGSMMSPQLAAQKPISLINSGPAMAPLAARISVGASAGDLIVSDTGGTTFDVSVVRDGNIPISTENYVGSPREGLFCGYPSVEVQSVGAGGGSIAWVDGGGLLRVGPQSAGANPGPACYGKGGRQATLTDAAVARGIIEPSRFLGGRLGLDVQLAREAIEEHVARPLGLSVEEAATRIMELATEAMVRATEEATMRHGIDPSRAAFVGGGGASGFNAVQLARRLGCNKVFFPACSPVLSAFGMTVAAPSAEARCVLPMRCDSYDGKGVAAHVKDMFREAVGYIPEELRQGKLLRSEYFVSAKYEGQVWELDIAVPETELSNIVYIVQAFHSRHESVYGFFDPGSLVELLSWRVRAIVANCIEAKPMASSGSPVPSAHRKVYLDGSGFTTIQVYSLRAGARIVGQGPAIIESDYTTILVEGSYAFASNDAGDLEVSIA